MSRGFAQTNKDAAAAVVACNQPADWNADWVFPGPPHPPGQPEHIAGSCPAVNFAAMTADGSAANTPFADYQPGNYSGAPNDTWVDSVGGVGLVEQAGTPTYGGSFLTTGVSGGFEADFTGKGLSGPITVYIKVSKGAYAQGLGWFEIRDGGGAAFGIVDQLSAAPHSGSTPDVTLARDAVLLAAWVPCLVICFA